MIRSSWFIYALLATLSWGLWGFFPRIATKHLDAKSVLIWETLGGLILGIAVLINLRFRPVYNHTAFFSALITGFSGILGMFFFLLSLKSGAKLSVAVTMTALYPVISIALAFLFLKEPVSAKQMFGILLALIAMYLFASK